MKRKVSATDELNLKKIRHNVSSFLKKSAAKYDKKKALLLDIAPQDHEGAAPYFRQAEVETLDIDKDSGATYIADICKKNNKLIASDRYDFVICTEVLEHTLQPFKAAAEMKRIVKPGGLLFVSVPFNLRIHGPLPDCWRFTEHGLRELFKDLNIIALTPLEDKDRFLMPTHYTLVARKPK